MDRLLRKFQTAASHVPVPVERKRKGARQDVAVLHFGTTDESLHEALDILKDDGQPLDDLRIRAFPFSAEVKAFIDRYPRILLVEQNRDAQMRTLIAAELGVPRDKMIPILNYNGLPPAATELARDIKRVLQTT